MTDNENLHDEAEAIRSETAADAPELAEHDRVGQLERELDEAKSRALYAAAESSASRRSLISARSRASASPSVSPDRRALT